jgi:ABC-type antimicrobial peptide transport system permease subunit
MALLNRQLVKLVLVAFAFGSLAGYLLIDKLIFRFILVYHSPISPFVFAIALLVITLSAGLTVGLKVFRAARLNPVDVLKND